MLSEKHAKGIEDRGLSVEMSAAMGLYSGRRSRDGSIVPDENGNILCWPYFEHGEEVNTKYRWAQDGQRRFQQRPNAPKTVYNADVLLDENTMTQLEVGQESLIWVEGEFDVQAGKESGYETVISVPDGAPPARDAKGKLIAVPDDARDIDPEDDDKFAFMSRLMDPIMRVKHHIICTDADEPGRRMAKELVRRIGAAKCFWAEYPKDEVVPDKKNKGKLRAPKDLNEVKQYLGAERVRDMIDNAKPWPVTGLFRLSDYPEMEIPQMCEIGLSEELDRLMKFYAGQFVIATGVPNVGKSTLMNQAAVLMAKKHKWPIAIFSGEKDVKPFLGHELMTAFLEKPRKDWSFEEKQRAEAFVERYFQFIDYDESADFEIDVDFLLERAATAVFRDGVKMLLIDPWNELEHNRPMNVSLTEYVGKMIKKLKRFAKQFGVCVVVVAHPTKLAADQKPGLYNISDSAHWANKADLGVVVHSGDPEDPYAREIDICKVRLKRIAGNTGIAVMSFDERTGLFVKPFS
ncbi:DnaB-like helicase C-terminal domain-containing protein [Bradyrhizobium sp. th.b2]|uniref:DnaB-like helicase C-terminal domain-containing protein n=1 Tax=Bradyrhizobium sp. th-b2 TaxID=172088 RepID=UPI000419828D|nr:DnaB-like helicase C-terminal domain-containing protein [Bradyrhizobium sp. th.b2]